MRHLQLEQGQTSILYLEVLKSRDNLPAMEIPNSTCAVWWAAGESRPPNRAARLPEMDFIAQPFTEL
jgi:hypothetical protein